MRPGTGLMVTHRTVVAALGLKPGCTRSCLLAVRIFADCLPRMHAPITMLRIKPAVQPLGFQARKVLSWQVLPHMIDSYQF